MKNKAWAMGDAKEQNVSEHVGVVGCSGGGGGGGVGCFSPSTVLGMESAPHANR